MIHWFNRFSTSLLMRIVAMVLILPVGYCAAPEETTAIEAIRKMFADGLYEAVDRQSAEFASQFQNSEHLPEIWLIQARAKIRVGRVDDAILILTQNRDRAGQRLEEFDFWHAMALGAKGDWNAAADAFGRFLASHTNSVLRIQAAYHQAYSKYRAGDTAGAVALLNAPDGPIRTRSETNKGDVWIQRSLLLLADMQLASGKNTEAASTLAELPEGLTAPELAWYRSYLTARIHALSNRWAEALANLTNIWTTVTNNLSPEILAGAALLEGEAFERTGQLQRARSSYERALARTTPADQRRAAMQRIVALGSAPEAVSDTINWLESFVSSHAGDELLDIATFSIGQLRLNQYLALVRAGASTIPGTNLPVTNLLHQARARFDMVITNYPSSAFLGEAYFGRGCCLWEEGTNRLSDMLLSFKSAVEKTSSPAVREIAIFKLADTQVLMGDFATARSNYWYVATNRVGLASGTNDIAAQALFQVVRTSIDMNDMAAASAALQRLIDTSPGSPLAERAVLMLGYAYLRLGNAEAARSSFQSFVNTFT
ncbi:MAG: tetratricopeptide repeat protein, partial [Verrucomicrobiae bacterium]|nr:tetratricopeptide repeat protein [Verrucomicrobiae bacterium]